jgi:chitin disaccharide deacetylase
MYNRRIQQSRTFVRCARAREGVVSTDQPRPYGRAADARSVRRTNAEPLTAEIQMRAKAILLLFTIAAPATAQQAPSWARGTSDGTGIRLFVRGDDFGTSHSSNTALSESLEAGVLGWASVIVVGQWVTEATRILQRYPEASVGLHLTLTSEWDQLRWGPLLSAAEVPTLLAPDGAFFKNYWRNSSNIRQQLATLEPEAQARLIHIMASELPAPRQVEAELRAQVERAKALGLRIDYIDCHMGVACLPELRAIMFELAAELCVPIPENGWMGHREVGFRIEEDPAATIQNFRDLLLSLGPGLYRLVTHPAADTPEARAIDATYGNSEARKRQAVLTALRADEIRRAIVERGIELVSVRNLWDYEACQLKQ